ncbi:putative polarized growth protein (Boi2) [Aspergillus candidus]|uniref:Polarized growth protein n=1 Tax=Aspergillus candidus TaxID=41067 RepID=A0A2I2F128_ASPCN|nr:hypothetical protein BDW47DRAFT_120457 [Aspergillus candidus]PLB34330.1 hypothetical protein BDW47DRAFT_120457 [Aspergillus candidus]
MALTSPPRGVKPGDHLLVVHDFDARGPDELTLRRGEKIELVEMDDGFGDGWYLGKDTSSGASGLFPGVYTTAAPKIPIRHRTESEADTSHTNAQSTSEGQSLSSETTAVVPKSGESTPHASRHASLSDMRAPDLDAASFAPKPPQRASSSPLPTAKMAVDVQRSLRQGIDGQLAGPGQESPVMNETLSVIDEHITDLSTPRHSMAPHQEHSNNNNSKVANDSASEYSSHLENRMSYINGHETDEEEENHPTEDEVRQWDPAETARYLRQLGLEARHCDIFEEQEITGDVLLDMDQDFLFMKEFDFGVMGRRLKTWHRIKAFQEEVKGVIPSQRQSSRGSTSGFATPVDDRSLSRAGHTSYVLPRIPHVRGSTGSHRLSGSLPTSFGAPGSAPGPLDHARRPSAASIRDVNHSRRHSSIDTTNRFSTAADGSPPLRHHQSGSFDRSWTLNGGGSQRAQPPPRPGTSLGAAPVTASPDAITPPHAVRGSGSNGSDSAIVVNDDLDRGYFSGPEADTRRVKRLQKRTSMGGSMTSRLSSGTDEPPYRLLPGSRRRHSRIGSADSIRDAVPPPPAGASARSSYAAPAPPVPKGRFRSLSTRITDRQAHPSATARSSEEKASSPGILAALSPFTGKADRSEKPDRDTRAMSLNPVKNAGPKFRRAMGFRTSSDVAPKRLDTTVGPASPARDVDPASARTGSTTPSTSKSSERHSTDGSAKNADGSLSLPRSRTTAAKNGTGTKSKKDTSAYTRGLEKKSPQEQMRGCDYAGWMKKRSSNLMTTWKPRLFVLRGRRLSYYYSEQDTEERGLIDITAHRVLRADHDPIVALHATLTGATASPTSPPTEKVPLSESTLRAPKQTNEGPFFFKLVPPKTGHSRTVQFTKPAIHYFQVDNVKEGRLWMAALMKATIERDLQSPVESSNKQRTISLKEARLMNQRPPSLMAAPPTPEEPETQDQPLPMPPSEATGLRTQGLRADGMTPPAEPAAAVDEDKPASNQLGQLDTGPTSLLPDLYLYLYPVFQGCAFPLPTPNEEPSNRRLSYQHSLHQHLAPHSAPDPALVRVLVLADPQLEGDSSLPKPEHELPARLRYHWESVSASVQRALPSPRHDDDDDDNDNDIRTAVHDIRTAVSSAVRALAKDDLPRALRAARKRLDLLGNDYYLAHIYRTLHWWSRPTHVTVLGDLIGSQWVTDEEFDRRGGRYWDRVFRGGQRVPDELTVTGAEDYTGSHDGAASEAATLEELELQRTDSPWAQRIVNIVGNHDVGYAGDASESRLERFERVFGRANYDIRFRAPPVHLNNDTSTITPILHLINLNTLTLDTPALSPTVQTHTYAYLNDVIFKRSYPVEDRSTFTLLLTHLPLHKQDGICTDGPYFSFFDKDDDNGPGGVPRFHKGGLKEQNHLSEHLSATGVLQGIFGMSGELDAPAAGRGRNGLILTGHDHTGCDVVHFVDRSAPASSTPDDTEAEADALKEDEQQQEPQWTWSAKRFNQHQQQPDEGNPSIREVTLRSMMGEFGGNAALLSLWFDADPAVLEWRYEITMCAAGVQHLWWAVHVVGFVTLVVGGVYGLLLLASPGSATAGVKAEVEVKAKAGDVAKVSGGKVNVGDSSPGEKRREKEKEAVENEGNT